MDKVKGKLRLMVMPLNPEVFIQKIFIKTDIKNNDIHVCILVGF